MKKSVILLLILIISSCKNNRQDETVLPSDSTSNSGLVNQRKSERPPLGVILTTDNVRLFGDTTIQKEKLHLISIKFEPYISFEDFKVDVKKSVKAQLDFSSNRGAYNFRTRIKEVYKADTVNFAGHYTFVSWGCGSPCQAGVIVDRRTGRIYDAPSAALGYDFRADSRMLIVNVPDSLGFYDDCVYCKPEIYVLDEKNKQFMKRLPNRITTPNTN